MTNSTSFSELKLIDPLLNALAQKGYTTPTPIQAAAIPGLLQGKDMLGVAQTGTGKTAAFCLPMLQILSGEHRRVPSKAVRALILTPTRELASQIADNIAAYGAGLKLRHTVIFGGVGQNPQVQTLRRGVEILVATPGRLLDLMGQGHADLSLVEIFVLDEADRMLDMGFIRDVRKIIDALPKKRQSLLFSATMPEDIVALAHRLLHDPVRVEVTPPATTVERIDQRILFVEKNDKRALLGEVLSDPELGRALVFTRTKHGANRAAEYLKKSHVSAEAIHGNKSQGARERALEGFKTGKVKVLVATDIAARGIDVPGIDLVVNFDLPNVPESYVHRIGRTARAGREGRAISFCDVEERAFLKDIERTIRRQVPVVENHPFRSTIPFTAAPPPAAKRANGGGGRGGGARRRRR
ncbi:MAG: DEAD/DEAH box helicase [Deltaproteobacteria bacterium]|nr:DEAD/DEAH box helicase [Deltaproteobacteria bacterium]